MLKIENIPLDFSENKHGLTAKLAEMEIGQSVFVPTSYGAASSCVRSAKARVKNPLRGEFRILVEANGVRVGRLL